MRIISSVFSHNGELPAKYTCVGEKVNPPLQFIGVPSTTKSLVLICDDPDAVGGVFTHWLIINMPPTVTEIAENTTPFGMFIKTSSGSLGYESPCPPAGTGVHRYRFTLFALDCLLDLPESSTEEDVRESIEGHVLDQAELIGLFSK